MTKHISDTYPKNSRTNTRHRSVSRRDLEKALVEFLDYFSDEVLMNRGLKNSPSLRRVLFFRYFLSNNGNASRAAIQAGYSPKSAKQQGYRVLKWLQQEIADEALSKV